MEQIERYETVIIGAGQAGLSVGYHLARAVAPPELREGTMMSVGRPGLHAEDQV